MIHLVTLENELPDIVVHHVCELLYIAYGVGCEHVGEGKATSSGAVDALEVVKNPPMDPGFSDDKLLLISTRPLEVPEGPLGRAPAGVFGDRDLGRGVISTVGLTVPASTEVTEENEGQWAFFGDRLARRAVHLLGLLWGLHRCVSVKCAMYVPWCEDLAPEDEQATLCDFCRDKSEAALRHSRS